MRYAGIDKFEVCNGLQIGVSLFVQGCPLHCKGCFNQETWYEYGGNEFTDNTLNEFITLGKRNYIKRISILGGEPLADYNIDSVILLLKRLRDEFNNTKSFWLFTGYNMDEIKNDKKKQEVIKLVDYLVYGRFIQELKDITLKFRGSKNQRILDCKNTIDLDNPIYRFD